MVSVLCALPLLVSAQQLTSSKEVIDCGQVIYRNPISVNYVVKNSGVKPLSISKVLTNCGCAAVEYPLKVIASGDSGVVKVTFDAKQMGHFNKQIGIYTNDSQPPLMLTLKGVVVNNLSEFPVNYPFRLGDLMTDVNNIEFDDINHGDIAQIKVHIKNGTEKIAQPTLMHLPVYLKAEVYPSKIAPGHTGVATITLDSQFLRDYGLTQTSIYLGFVPGDQVAENKELSVSTVLLPEFNKSLSVSEAKSPHIKLSSTTLDLGLFGNKKKVSGKITIENTGQAELDIENVQMFTQGVRLSLKKTKLAPGVMTEMKITAFADGIKRARSKPRILMITNDPENPKIVVTINVK